MTSLLTRLENDLAVCEDRLRQAELHAERACYLARIGEFAEANAVTNALRRDFGDGKSPAILIWIMLVEGLVLYFDTLDSSAHDRLLRAQILSERLNLNRLEGLTSAWLAHLEFERGNYHTMAELLMSASDAAIKFPDVRSRIEMIIADCHFFLGDRKAALRWFRSVHSLSVLIGDQASIGAMIYNRAVFGLSELVMASYLGTRVVTLDALRSIEAELESARNYQRLSLTRSLPHVFMVCQAQIYLLYGRWSEALQLLKTLESALPNVDQRANRPNMLADISLCLVNIGRSEEALVAISGFNTQDIHALDADDRFLFSSRILQALSIACPQSDLESKYRRLSAEARTSYLQEMHTLEDAVLQLRDKCCSDAANWPDVSLNK